MAQAVLRIDWLPPGALDAAGEFHEGWLDEAIALLEGGAESLVIVVPPAAYDHEGWRRAATQDLAREWAPQRVSMIAGDDEQAIAATLAYLADAPGVTGQLLVTSGAQAGNAAH